MLGVEVSEVDCLYFDYVLVVYYLILFLEVLSNLVCFDVMCYGLWVGDDGICSVEEVMVMIWVVGFGFEVKWCIMIGIYVLLVGYYDVYYN